MKALLALIIVCSTGVLAAGCSSGSCGWNNSWGSSYARPYVSYSNYSSCSSGNCGGMYYARPITYVDTSFYQAPCSTCQKPLSDPCDNTAPNDNSTTAPTDNSQVNKPVAPVDNLINKPTTPAENTQLMNQPVAPTQCTK